MPAFIEKAAAGASDGAWRCASCVRFLCTHRPVYHKNASSQQRLRSHDSSLSPFFLFCLGLRARLTAATSSSVHSQRMRGAAVCGANVLAVVSNPSSLDTRCTGDLQRTTAMMSWSHIFFRLCEVLCKCARWTTNACLCCSSSRLAARSVTLVIN